MAKPLDLKDMQSKISFRKIIMCALVCSCCYSSCSTRYWFRKKINVEKDTAEVEKQFQIAW